MQERDRKVKNSPDSSIYRSKIFRMGKKWVNQIFALIMCLNYNFAPKGWLNSRFIRLSIWKLLPNFLTACFNTGLFPVFVDTIQTVWTPTDCQDTAQTVWTPTDCQDTAQTGRTFSCVDTFKPVWTLFRLSGSDFPVTLHPVWAHAKLSRLSGHFLDCVDTFQTFQKVKTLFILSGHFPECPDTLQIVQSIRTLFILSVHFPDCLYTFQIVRTLSRLNGHFSHCPDTLHILRIFFFLDIYTPFSSILVFNV